jgi:hypothetical protein
LTQNFIPFFPLQLKTKRDEKKTVMIEAFIKFPDKHSEAISEYCEWETQTLSLDFHFHAHFLMLFEL